MFLIQQVPEEAKSGNRENVQELASSSVSIIVQEALMAERERGANWQCHSSPQPGISVTSDRQTLQPPAGPSAASRQFAWRYQPDPLNILDNSNADHKRASPTNASEVDPVNGTRLPLDSEVMFMEEAFTYSMLNIVFEYCRV
jgi:hypothetical protein